ncbi:MAG: hypothetical protein ABUL42_04110 [Terricaulis silvestris]
MAVDIEDQPARAASGRTPLKVILIYSTVLIALALGIIALGRLGSLIP